MLVADAARCPEELQRAFFKLVAAILLHHWKHFVPSGIRGRAAALAAQTGGSASAGPSSPHGAAHFIRLLQTIGSSLESAEISPSLLRCNLACLDRLHAAHNLFSRPEFAGDGLRLQFLKTLFLILLRRSHELLREEVTNTIHSMVSVDFDGFHGDFLFAFLTEATVLADGEKQQLLEGFSTDRDIPSFNASVQRFVNDFVFFAAKRSSVDSGGGFVPPR